MFKHVFATMQEMLEEIIIHYPHANGAQRKQLDDQLSSLKQFSDTFIEEWLQFEEKMADFRDLQLAHSKGSSSGQAPLKPAAPASGYPKIISAVPAPPVQQHKPAAASKGNPPVAAAIEKSDPCDDFDDDAAFEMQQAMSKGQGYFKLFMFKDAFKHFQDAVRRSPDDNRARLFLGMTCMHLQEWHEAQRHFQLLVEVTEHPKWKAIGLNALGCIQAVRMNLEQAAVYFEKAHEADPNFTDPLSNMKSCEQHAGQLSLLFGSGQL
ncbi:tetratricopeptide repeat protein [Paenibacillus sp. CF384]|uniref:tetratricopeptide repeat protein n=1 Tax=Paenibacillus sp. CF384 TaxID=1884382 RepID=UPI00089D32EF|nr:tetratricopeptide repeat protein [Paenibacillus sp. CF384]SDW29569.1 hypothetical protein SAMN05518855_1001976 [Paenibacillus sp. CF384]